MFLPLSWRDPWFETSGWPSMRSLDEDLQQLSALLRIGPSARCDRNGVLTLTPNYRYDRVDGRIRVEVDLPGVEKSGLSVEVHDGHLKIVAAKYTPDSRSRACQCGTRRRRRRRTAPKPTGDAAADAAGDADAAAEPVQSQQGEDSPPLPSVVYRLDVRLSSRADADAVTAGYRGDGVLRICIPLRKEPSRKVVVNIEG